MLTSAFKTENPTETTVQRSPSQSESRVRDQGPRLATTRLSQRGQATESFTALVSTLVRWPEWMVFLQGISGFQSDDASPRNINVVKRHQKKKKGATPLISF